MWLASMMSNWLDEVPFLIVVAEDLHHWPRLKMAREGPPKLVQGLGRPGKPGEHRRTQHRRAPTGVMCKSHTTNGLSPHKPRKAEHHAWGRHFADAVDEWRGMP